MENNDSDVNAIDTVNLPLATKMNLVHLIVSWAKAAPFHLNHSPAERNQRNSHWTNDINHIEEDPIDGVLYHGDIIHGLDLDESESEDLTCLDPQVHFYSPGGQCLFFPALGPSEKLDKLD